MLREVLRDTMAVTGALFALLVAATMFTLVVRAFGTDRWVAACCRPGRRAVEALCSSSSACSWHVRLVLDAFEMIFVVIPIALPPLLTRVPDATWVAVLTLLILQTSFLAAAVRLRGADGPPPACAAAFRSLPWPARSCPISRHSSVLFLVLAWPSLVWQRNPTTIAPDNPAGAVSDDDARRMLERQLAPPPDEDAGKEGKE